MELSQKLEALYDKGVSVAYKNLQELEAVSEKEDVLYDFCGQFLAMLRSEKYLLRVRGFRLLCKQAKWDCKNKLNAVIEELLAALDDEKPTAVRQALKALECVVLHKKELRGAVKSKLLAIDYSAYQDSMRGLIAKDAKALLQLIESQ